MLHRRNSQLYWAYTPCRDANATKIQIETTTCCGGGGAVWDEEAMSGISTWIGGGWGSSSWSSRLNCALHFIRVCLLRGSCIFIFGYPATLMPDYKMLLNRDSAIQSASSAQSRSQKNRIPCSCPNNVIYCLDAQLSKASSVWTTRNFRPDLPLCREASNCSSFHPSRRHSVFDKQWDFFPKTQIWEDSCNRPDDVDSRPDTPIHKVSIVFKIQTSGCQSSWSRRASY
jgi:hypothetical protein